MLCLEIGFEALHAYCATHYGSANYRRTRYGEPGSRCDRNNGDRPFFATVRIVEIQPMWLLEGILMTIG